MKKYYHVDLCDIDNQFYLGFITQETTKRCYVVGYNGKGEKLEIAGFPINNAKQITTEIIENTISEYFEGSIFCLKPSNIHELSEEEFNFLIK